MMLEHLFVEVKFTSALTRVVEISVVISLYTLGLYFIFQYLGHIRWEWLDTAQSSFAAMIGLLLVFRTNKAYERWWEARSLWGSLVNTSRNLAIKVKVILAPNPEQAQDYAKAIINFRQALAIHLRKSPDDEELARLVDTTPTPQHVPAHLAKELFDKLYHHLPDERAIDRLMLAQEFSSLMDVCGGCEKIKTTFISISYRMFVKHVMIIFILAMPWSLIDNIGLYSIPVVIFTSYVMLALEAIARNLEEPFGVTEDHVQLCQINNGIERSVEEILLAP